MKTQHSQKEINKNFKKRKSEAQSRDTTSGIKKKEKMENFPELKNWGFHTERSHPVPNTIHKNRSVQGLS